MSTWEPEGWNFNDSDMKLHVFGKDNDSESSSSGDISGDDQLFANSKSLKKTKYKKIEKEELLPEWIIFPTYSILLTMKAAMQTVTLVTQELETQSLNAIVAGFSFAAAMSWMDVVRFIINQVIKVPKNGGAQYALTAVLTTLLSIAVYMMISTVSTRVSKPAQPVYAITR